MTTYYVRPDGNDTNAGTGYIASEAWLTATKAKSTVAAGDTVHIAPGTYREVITLATAGTLGNVISWLGDPSCKIFLDLKQGAVRLTGCDGTELPGAAVSIIDCNAKGYQLFRDLVIDGNQNGTYRGVSAGGFSTITIDRCIISGSTYGVYGGSTSVRPVITNSLIISGSFGVYRGAVYNSIILAGGAGSERSVLYNCICSGGDAAAQYPYEAVNCLFIGAAGISATAAPADGFAKNCIAFACAFGFSGQQQYMALTNCLAVSCRYGAYGTSSLSPLDVSGVKTAYCGDASRGGISETGVTTPAKHCGFANLYKIWNLASALRFDQFNERDWADDTVSWPGDTVDIIGKIRRLYSGLIDVGPMEYQDQIAEWTDFKTTAPAFRINRKGESIFNIPVLAGVARSISVWMKFSLGSGSLKPSLAVSAADGCITPGETIAAGDGSAFEQVLVAFTATVDGTVQIKMRANETDAAAYSIFSDLFIG